MRSPLTSPGGTCCSIFFLPTVPMHLCCNNLTWDLQLAIRSLEAESWLFIQIVAAFFTVLVQVGHPYIFICWLSSVWIIFEYWLLYESWFVLLTPVVQLHTIKHYSRHYGFIIMHALLLLSGVTWKNATTVKALPTLLPKQNEENR